MVQEEFKDPLPQTEIEQRSGEVFRLGDLEHECVCSAAACLLAA